MFRPPLFRIRELLRTVGMTIIGTALVSMTFQPEGYNALGATALIITGLLVWLVGAIERT